MGKKIILLAIFVLGMYIDGYSQNKFTLEFGAGSNYSSAFLEKEILEVNEDIVTQNTKDKYGVNARVGVKYNLLKRLYLKSNINYSKINYVYNLIDWKIPGEPLNHSDIGEIKSNITGNSLGFSLGLEYFIIRYISFSFFTSYNKMFKKKTKSYIHWSSWRDPNYKENFENWNNLKGELSSSLEVSFSYKRFSLVPGFEYTFTKEKFFPTENLGNRYKYYLLLAYSIK